MLRRVFIGLALLSVLVTSHAAGAPPTPAPKVARVVIKKKDHKLELRAADDSVIGDYKVAIGPGGMGPKRKEGDMTTPVGRYHITMHQPSQYKIFLRLDYPNASDFRRFNAAKERGDLPKNAQIGGDIGIHGPPLSVPALLKPAMKLTDWTAGCIALDDDEISEVAKLVKDGTAVDIED
jgi:murein L,D-transpeptidase YafK